MARIFKNGQSQAVRLPKEFRFKEDHVYVKRVGKVVTLIPASSFWQPLLQSLQKFSADFMADRDQPAAQSRDDLA